MIGSRPLLPAIAALGLVAATQAQAKGQSYPNRPVRIIVPTVAGGTVDVITRLVANDLSSRLGASFIVDNRSGAGNTLGSREAARADPDGHTLLMSSASGQVVSPLVYKSVDYDPIKSFAPIGLVAEGSIILVVNPSLPFKSVHELAVMSKTRIPDLPDVPSATESGYPSLVVTTWTGLFAPAGTDPAIVGKLNAALSDGLPSLALQAALAKVGNLAMGGPPEALAQMIVAEKEKWVPIVKALNLKAD